MKASADEAFVAEALRRGNQAAHFKGYLSAFMERSVRQSGTEAAKEETRSPESPIHSGSRRSVIR